MMNDKYKRVHRAHVTKRRHKQGGGPLYDVAVMREGGDWPGAGAAAAPAEAARLGGGPAAARQRCQAAHLQHTPPSIDTHT